MDETTFFDYFMLGAIILIGFYVVITLVQKNDLKENGIETEALIIEWNPMSTNGLNNVNRESINIPTVKFTTKDGKEIMGQPITGIYYGGDYQGDYLIIIYDPENPEQFMIKEE